MIQEAKNTCIAHNLSAEIRIRTVYCKQAKSITIPRGLECLTPKGNGESKPNYTYGSKYDVNIICAKSYWFSIFCIKL